ncbi:hypothetical protein NFI96_005852 [Prochilodus magdalenae]|nr:hypothetical protein NFI96_005852 [Prochilodus magdalenae]
MGASGLRNASSPAHDLIRKSHMLSPGPPTRYCLCTTRSNLNKEGKIRKWTFGQRYANTQNKTILMVGETGTGKTTLINTMVNYFLGVKFEDKVWFEITEEEQRDPAETQTSEVTVYEINSEERLSSLTIIDTPGYRDTRGIEKDMDIARNLHDLFLHGTGVKDLDAVCLVLKASQNRISDRQRYIFNAVLSLFGKDIEDIIVLCITHSDGGPPTNALQAIKQAKVPCCYNDEDEPVHFLFNNRQSEKRTQQYEHRFKSFWEMGERSMEGFCEFLKPRRRRSVTLTVSVLNERMQLEACVESLKENIRYREAKQNELTEVQEALKLNKVMTERDKKFPLTVTTVYKVKVGVTGASWRNRMVTSCGKCEKNCHEHGCWVARKAQRCKVMKDNWCTVCNCHYSIHVREGKKYVTTRREEKVTVEKLKNEYGSTCGEKASYDENLFKYLEKEHKKALVIKEMIINLEAGLETLLAQNEAQKKSLVRDAYMSIIKLSEIALKPDSAFTIQHLDFLIPQVEEAGTAEWAQQLRDLQRAAASQELTNSAVGCLGRKGNAPPKESTDSAEGYTCWMNRDTQNAPPKESTDSAVGCLSRKGKDMQNAPPKESSDSAEGCVGRKGKDMRSAPPKESTDSAEGYTCWINRDTQNAPPKESTDSAVGDAVELEKRIMDPWYQNHPYWNYTRGQNAYQPEPGLNYSFRNDAAWNSPSRNQQNWNHSYRNHSQWENRDWNQYHNNRYWNYYHWNQENWQDPYCNHGNGTYSYGNDPRWNNTYWNEYDRHDSYWYQGYDNGQYWNYSTRNNAYWPEGNWRYPYWNGQYWNYNQWSYPSGRNHQYRTGRAFESGSYLNDAHRNNMYWSAHDWYDPYWRSGYVGDQYRNHTRHDVPYWYHVQYRNYPPKNTYQNDQHQDHQYWTHQNHNDQYRNYSSWSTQNQDERETDVTELHQYPRQQYPDRNNNHCLEVAAVPTAAPEHVSRWVADQHRLRSTFPGPLMRNDLDKIELVRFIQWKAVECSCTDQSDHQAGHVFWKMMELFCTRENISRDSDDQQRTAVIAMGDTLASAGLINPAHICYTVALVQLSSFRGPTSLVLVGSHHRHPFSEFATSEALERTEVYEYLHVAVLVGSDKNGLPC